MEVSFGVMGKLFSGTECGIVKLIALLTQRIRSAWNLPGGLA
jgi:hypothetical protein